MRVSTRALKLAVWTPVAFSAMLSIMKLSFPEGAGDPAFFSFLPMCFFFMAVIQISLLNRIEILEDALGENTAPSREAEGESTAVVEDSGQS